jgi:hypothetical protein
VQLFATAFGAALAGMVTNLAGFTTPGGIEGAASAAHWLFLLFALAPLLAIYSAWRSAAISQPAEEPSNFVQTPGSGEC